MTAKKLKTQKKHTIRYIRQFFAPCERKYVDKYILPYYIEALERLYYRNIYEESMADMTQNV